MDELIRRKKLTSERIRLLVEGLNLAPEMAKRGEAAVCATGSIGRGEASEHSDIDLQLITRVRIEANGKSRGRSTLSLLDEIVLKADIISAFRALDIKQLDADGRYFNQFTIERLIHSIGASEDDASNAFTSRLLLLLESVPLLGHDVYEEAVQSIIGAYWSDYEGRQDSFIPAFFTNDILRLWRTFCVNYESRTRNLKGDERLKRKVKNLKLKYNRMMTCYSAIIFLLHEYACHNTVSPATAASMVMITPVERFQHVANNAKNEDTAVQVGLVLQAYNNFMLATNVPDEDLLRQIAERDTFEAMRDEAHRFGDSVFGVLNAVGGGSRFHRLIIV